MAPVRLACRIKKYIADGLTARQHVATGAHRERKSRKDVFLLYGSAATLLDFVHFLKRILTPTPPSQANYAKKATRA